MSEQLTTYNTAQSAHVAALMFGDLSRLSETEKLNYYNAVCESLNLNALTKPFEFLTLNGKLVLYATKNCAEQLRENHGISLEITQRTKEDDLYIVAVRATNNRGRTDESLAAVDLKNLYGEKLANAIMKAETKAKRRATLSICGLGMMDDTESEQFIQQPSSSIYDENFDYASEDQLIEIEKAKINAILPKPQLDAIQFQIDLTRQKKMKTKINGQTITAIHIDDVEPTIKILNAAQPPTDYDRELKRLEMYVNAEQLFEQLAQAGQKKAKEVLQRFNDTGEVDMTLKDLFSMNNKIQAKYEQLISEQPNLRS